MPSLMLFDITFLLQHLFTCDLDGKEMRCVADCVQRLKLLDEMGRVWGQNMLMEVRGSTLLLTDTETKVTMMNDDWRENLMKTVCYRSLNHHEFENDVNYAIQNFRHFHHHHHQKSTLSILCCTLRFNIGPHYLQMTHNSISVLHLMIWSLSTVLQIAFQKLINGWFFFQQNQKTQVFSVLYSSLLWLRICK